MIGQCLARGMAEGKLPPVDIGHDDDKQGIYRIAYIGLRVQPDCQASTDAKEDDCQGHNYPLSVLDAPEIAVAERYIGDA